MRSPRLSRTRLCRRCARPPLLLLYRLLFILYAEDRDLLPVRDWRYDDYALRDRVRGDVGRRKDQDDVFSETAARYWSVVADLCRAIDQGDVAIGLPPYNGGLFDRERAPLLDRIRLGDRVMADVIEVSGASIRFTIRTGRTHRCWRKRVGVETHQRRRTPLTGFEVRAPHRGAILFLPQQRPALHLCRTQTHRQGVAIFRDRLGSVG